ncbi:hypothetical protein [Psychroflexus aestuariivivens]|uniref:hypothetical protein n=1 Tax=Psychroflexus aestuariivivens TaxID=1795040 RepID=UPI000FDB495C|nr:hypothetical protein [Psychroflexus aestuariivivens]
MKSLKLNILQVFMLFFCATVFIGCEEENKNQIDENLMKSGLNQVDLDLSFYGDFDESKHEKVIFTETFEYIVDGRTYESEFTTEYNTTTEMLIKVSIGENYFVKTGLNISDIESQYETYGDPNPNDGMTPHARCIESCKDKYTDANGNKIRGRGGCKANCWVDTGVKILTLGLAA